MLGIKILFTRQPLRIIFIRHKGRRFLFFLMCSTNPLFRQRRYWYLICAYVYLDWAEDTYLLTFIPCFGLLISRCAGSIVPLSPLFESLFFRLIHHPDPGVSPSPSVTPAVCQAKLSILRLSKCHFVLLCICRFNNVGVTSVYANSSDTQKGSIHITF